MAPPKTTLAVQAGASSASANAGDMPLHITINPFDIAPGGGIVRHPSTATPIASQGATGVQAVPPPAELPDSPSLPVLPDHSLPASPITLAPPKTTLAVQADASSASANAGKLPLHITINPFDIAPGGGIVWPPSTATPIASQGATGVQAVLPPAELPDSPNGDFPKVPEPTPTQLEPSLFPLGAPATTLATPVLAAQPVAGANDLSLAAPIPGATPGSVSPILSELLGGQVPGLNAEGVPVSASAATPPHLIVNSGAILAAPVVVNVQSAADGSDAGSGASGTLGSTTGAKGSGTGRGSSSGSFAGSGSSGGSGSGTVSSGSRNGSNGSGSNVAIGGGDSGSSHTTAKAAISGVLVAGCVAVAIVGGVMYKRRVNAVAPAGKGSKMDFEKPKRFTGSTPPPLSPLDNVSVSSEVFAPSSKDSLPAKHPATFSSAKVAAPSSPVTAARHFLAKITGKNNQKEICLPSILFNRFLPLASLALPPTDPSAKPDQDIKGAKDFLMHVRSESLTSTTLSDILSSDGSTVAPTTDDDRSSVGDETRSSSSMSEASSLGRLLDGSFGNRSSVASSLGTTVSTPRIPRPAHLYSQRRATATPTYFRSPLSETYDARSSCAPTEMMTVDRRTSDASGSTLVETEGDSVASDSLGRYI
ncbi:hypothetical protein HKX48_003899 [Thoreauomyces humboldtii]|nr:hypothetical protein HKX48_003899 [Thoreauomyces humboldtii]